MSAQAREGPRGGMSKAITLLASTQMTLVLGPATLSLIALGACSLP